MKFLTLLFVFLDIAPPEPFTFGSFGHGSAVAFGLFLTAIAVAVFLLFRKRWSASTRGIIAGIFLLFGIGGGILIWQAFAHYDAEALKNRPVYHHVENPYARHDLEEPKPTSPENANTAQNKNSQTNSKK